MKCVFLSCIGDVTVGTDTIVRFIGYSGSLADSKLDSWSDPGNTLEEGAVRKERAQ